jgi:hypothetical protein
MIFTGLTMANVLGARWHRAGPAARPAVDVLGRDRAGSRQVADTQPVRHPVGTAVVLLVFVFTAHSQIPAATTIAVFGAARFATRSPHSTSAMLVAPGSVAWPSTTASATPHQLDRRLTGGIRARLWRLSPLEHRNRRKATISATMEPKEGIGRCRECDRA